MKRYLKMLKKHKELVTLFLFMALYIFLRSLNFIHYLTFIGWDQAEHVIIALNTYRNHDLVLIGPRVSAVLYQGRQVFLGPAMTYIMVFLMVLGRWDPPTASYIFMVLSGLMVIPLYYGVKWLMGKRPAWIMVILYTLVPYYLTYTRFLWNPNFQFALIPLLFFLMGYYKKSGKSWVLFLMSFWLGILFQLHYQFIFSIVPIAAYYFIYKREGLKKFLIFTAGFLTGISPLILFELRNKFYLTNTLWLFFKHRNELEMYGNRNHYYLSQSFVAILGALAIASKYIKKLPEKTFLVLSSILFIVLFVMSARITFVKPDTAFWAPVPYWNYAVELKAYEIIKDTVTKEHIKDFNVTNQMYDPLAMIQKYMMMRDGIVINYDDYWHEKYLFVIDRKGKENYMDNPGYEVLYVRPYKVLKNWDLNDHYVMHLIERLPKEQ